MHIGGGGGGEGLVFKWRVNRNLVRYIRGIPKHVLQEISSLQRRVTGDTAKNKESEQAKDIGNSKKECISVISARILNPTGSFVGVGSGWSSICALRNDDRNISSLHYPWWNKIKRPRPRLLLP